MTKIPENLKVCMTNQSTNWLTYWPGLVLQMRLHTIQYKHTILFCRVDAKVATDEKEETPLKIALERDNTEIVVLLCEAIGEEVPDKVKIEQWFNALLFQISLHFSIHKCLKSSKWEDDKLTSNLSKAQIVWQAHVFATLPEMISWINDANW